MQECENVIDLEHKILLLDAETKLKDVAAKLGCATYTFTCKNRLRFGGEQAPTSLRMIRTR